MRSLKTFAVALTGLIAAVFGIALFAAPTAPVAPTSTTANEALRPDLQAKRLTPANDALASREAKATGKTPQPQPNFPFADFSRSTGLRVARDFSAQPLLGALELLSDRRQRLLVGVVELRI